MLFSQQWPLSNGFSQTAIWIVINRKWKCNGNSIKMDVLKVYLDFWKPAILPSCVFSGSYVAALDVFSIGYPM